MLAVVDVAGCWCFFFVVVGAGLVGGYVIARYGRDRGLKGSSHIPTLTIWY